LDSNSNFGLKTLESGIIIGTKSSLKALKTWKQHELELGSKFEHELKLNLSFFLCLLGLLNDFDVGDTPLGLSLKVRFMN
jgi:hypothetical protein